MIEVNFLMQIEFIRFELEISDSLRFKLKVFNYDKSLIVIVDKSKIELFSKKNFYCSCLIKLHSSLM